ncbi:MAG: hypothetical protein LBR65_01275 [Culturomica sp.]|jgi:hypothetical protein|nr:hypothetical protein [Culturomica sp.]
MRKILVITLTFLALTVYGQNKYNYVHFNKLTEVVGTEYVIASVENFGKIHKTKSKYILFVNTKTNETKQVDFSNDSNIRKMEQIRIDSLGINIILVIANTVDLDGKKGIDWNAPTQIIVLSSDGKEKKQLTESKFFVRTWAVNQLTGTIVVTGHYDTNNNDKYEKTDENEIHVYDLKTLKLLSKI